MTRTPKPPSGPRHNSLDRAKLRTTWLRSVEGELALQKSADELGGGASSLVVLDDRSIN
jgi:hypothetical protein